MADDRAGSRAEILQAFARSLRREAHLLADRPDLTWQQLHNRLQWEGGAVEDRLAPQRASHTAEGAQPWLRTRVPLRESEAAVRVLAAHGEFVSGYAFHPDGALIVSGGPDGMTIWEISSGRKLAESEDHTGRVCEFSPDGRLIASASPGGIRLLELRTGRERPVLAGHTDAVKTCAFSPDGALITSVGADKTLRLWEVESGREVARLESRTEDHTDSLDDCSFSPDGTLVACAGGDGHGYREVIDQARARLMPVSVRQLAPPTVVRPDERIGVVTLREVGSGRERARLEVRRSGHAEDWHETACAFSPDGTLLASAGADGTVRLWEVASGAERAVLEGHTGSAHDCAFSPDGTLLASAGSDRTVRLWDVSSGREWAVLEGHTGSVGRCTFSQDGSLLASAGRDGIRIWEMGAVRPQPRLEGHTEGHVNDCAFSPDGALIASVAGPGLTGPPPGTVRLWDVSSGRQRAVLEGHTEAVKACAFSPDGAFLASSSYMDGVRIWDVESGSERTRPQGVSEYTHRVNDWALSPDGSLLALAGWDNAVRLWDIRSERLRAKLKGHSRWLPFLKGHTDSADRCAFSPDGSLLGSASRDQTIRLWEVEPGRQVRVLEGHTGWVRACAFSPDGASLASASNDGTARLWEVESGRTRAVIDLEKKPFDATFAFNPDGSLLALADLSSVWIWDAGSGREWARLDEAHCAFSPDGRWIASAGADRTLKVWDAVRAVVTAELSLPGSLTCIALHPWLPLAACGDVSGALYPVDLIQVDYGPIIVTAIDRGQGPAIRCPACRDERAIRPGDLGSETACSTPGCGLSLRVNPFVA